MELSFIFSIIGMAKTAAGLPGAVKRLMGEIHSLDEKVDLLLRSDLNAGLQSLQQAARAGPERDHLLREARQCFNRAFELEKGYRQGLALLGLAVCHHFLGDRANCKDALERLVELPPAISEWAVVGAVLRTLGPQPGQLRISYYDERIDSAIERSPEARSLLAIQKAANAVLVDY
jgi:tetratricopeptide (TPR) repeat protein